MGSDANMLTMRGLDGSVRLTLWTICNSLRSNTSKKGLSVAPNSVLISKMSYSPWPYSLPYNQSQGLRTMHPTVPIWLMMTTKALLYLEADRVALPSGRSTSRSREYTFLACAGPSIQNITRPRSWWLYKFFMKLFLHFVETATEQLDTVIAQTDQDLTVAELLNLAVIDYRRDIQPATAIISKAYKGDKVADLNDHISKHFEQGSDVFIAYEAAKPTKTEEAKKTEIFESISNYAFLDDDGKVLVYIEMPGIGNLPRANIQERFLDRSFEIKIRGYMNRNFVFAVPKTQCALVPEKSKVIQKRDKLTIHLAKVNPKDNWYSLYKTKAVGEVEEL